MSLRFIVYVVVAGLSLGAPAFAAPPPGPRSAPPASPKVKDRADELFEQGTAAVDAGRLAEAEAKFAEAWALKQTHDIAGNLGIIERHLGKNTEAARHLAWALQHLPPTEATATRKGLEEELQKARAEVGALRERVTVDGAAITVNGHDEGPSPLAAEVFVAPGAVTVTVRREGYVAAEQSVRVPKGEAREVSVVLVPAVGARRSVVPVIVLGSIAGVALGTGIGLLVDGGAKGSSAHDLHDAILKAGRSCVAGASNYDARCTQVSSASASGDTRHGAGVGLLVGAGAVAAGAAAYLLWPASATSTARARGVRVLPEVSATTAGLVVSGTF